MVRVPLVVLTGFLGSGKTTLVNRLLARRASRDAKGQLGVIVNELGEVDIDGALLASGGREHPTRQITLPGGCVCCVLGDDLDRTLLELVDANPELDAILLETTGVAEPLPIAWALERGAVNERVRLAAVVTLVDATLFPSSRPISGAVDAQVAYADVILITKSELAGARATDAVVAEVATLAPRSPVRIAGTDDHAAWLETVLTDPSIESIESGTRTIAPTDHVHDDQCGHLDHATSAHGIDSAWASVAGVVDLEELEDQLADLPGNYVRIKGIVEAVDGRTGQTSPRWVAVHRVGLRVSSEPVAAPAWKPGRLVALGPRVDSATLAECVSRAIP